MIWLCGFHKPLNADVGLTLNFWQCFAVTFFKINIATMTEMLKKVRSCLRDHQNFEERENQQDATIRCLLSTSVSTCFGHHYAHLQENNDRVTAFAVLFWFCWMWLVAVVGRCVVGCHLADNCFVVNKITD